MPKRGRSKSFNKSAISRSASAKRRKAERSPIRQSILTYDRKYRTADDFVTGTVPTRRRSVSPASTGRVIAGDMVYYSPRRAPMLWSHVDKTKVPAVDKVLYVHSKGKPGDGDFVFISSGRFYHFYQKSGGDVHTSLTLTALWSVRLEILHFNRALHYIGTQACALIDNNNIYPHTSFSTELDTVALFDWYSSFLETWPDRSSIIYADPIESIRKQPPNTQTNPEGIIFARNPILEELQDDTSTYIPSTPSTPIGPITTTHSPATTEPSQSVVFITRNTMEDTPLLMRVEQLIVVVTQPQVDLPVGWYFNPPPQHQTSFCVPLHFLRAVNDHERMKQIAEQLLRLASDPPDQEGLDLQRSLYEYRMRCRLAIDSEPNNFEHLYGAAVPEGILSIHLGCMNKHQSPRTNI